MQSTPCLAGVDDGLPPAVKIMPQYFSKLGYKSHLVGKWHQGYETPEQQPTRRGFDSFFGYLNGYLGYWDCTHYTNGVAGRDLRRNEEGAWRECYGNYLTELLTNEAVKVIRDHPEPDGLLLLLTHAAVHTTFMDIEREAPNGVQNTTGRGYLRAMIERLDWSVGEVVKALNERGLLNNTILVFIADNGAPTHASSFTNHGSNWPLRGEKGSVHDGGVRTVAAVWSPLLQNLSRISDQYFHISDWLPTLYAAAGGKSEELESKDGINQWDSLRSSTQSARDTIIINVDEETKTEAVIKNNWKLVKHNNPKLMGINDDYYYGESGRWMKYDAEKVNTSAVAQILGPIPDQYQMLKESASLNSPCPNETSAMAEDCHTDYCLFDILNDPTECYNLAANNSQIVADLKAIIDSYRPSLLPVSPKYFDSRANPKNWNDYWSPWIK
nr:arylsulfatase B-like [Halyomorpha halys]